MKTLINIAFLLLLTNLCLGQDGTLSENGFYIPKNMIECNQQLDKTLTKTAKEQLRQINEEYLARVYGIFIINEWFDNDTTILAKYFEEFSITDWEERDLLILKSYHRQLNNKPFDIISECAKLIESKNSARLMREAQNKIDIVSDSINGIFIPYDIFSCFIQLDKILNDTIKNDIKRKNSEIELAEYHMGLGRWMRNSWGLWSGSRLQQYFLNKSVHHPDNMSGIIILAYNKYLNGESVDIDKMIIDEKTQEEEIRKNITELTVEFDRGKFCTKEYKKFLRTRKITHVNLSV